MTGFLGHHSELPAINQQLTASICLNWPLGEPLSEGPSKIYFPWAQSPFTVTGLDQYPLHLCPNQPPETDCQGWAPTILFEYKTSQGVWIDGWSWTGRRPSPCLTFCYRKTFCLSDFLFHAMPYDHHLPGPRLFVCEMPPL